MKNTFMLLLSLLVAAAPALANQPKNLRVIPGVSDKSMEALNEEREGHIDSISKIYGLDANEAALVYFARAAEYNFLKDSADIAFISDSTNKLITTWKAVLGLASSSDDSSILSKISREQSVSLQEAELIHLSRLSESQTDKISSVNLLLQKYTAGLLALIKERRLRAP